MKTPPVPKNFEALKEFGMRATGSVVSGGVVVVLALTGPLFEFGDWITNNKN
jgi:hypothetical protein